MMDKPDSCEQFELLMQADIDGELDAAEAAAVTAHRNQCMRCMVHYKELMALRERVRDQRYQPASDQFRSRLLATLAAAQKAAQVPGASPPPVAPAKATPAAAAEPIVRPAITVPQPQRSASPRPALSDMPIPPRYPRRPWLRDIWAFAAGGVLAGCLLVPWLSVHGVAGPDIAGEVVSGHIRAMQANHLMDVASTDQHNVKPWFEGKVDFAPPVKNLAAEGYPLTGGRLDYLDQRTVAVMIYQGGKHPINLFAWPDASGNSSPTFSSVQGYHVAHWTQDGMALWAVSDMNAASFSQFTDAWRRASP